MYGETFLLLKPDGIKLNIVNELVNSLQNRNICVKEQRDIYLNKLDILNLWPYTQSDIISRQLFIRYLENKRCILFLLASECNEIHRSVSDVKKYYRQLYGKHQYSSVMHTPGNEEEYKKDMLVFEKKISGTVPNRTIIGYFECYKELQGCDITAITNKIWAHMSINHMHWLDKYGAERNFLVLYKNGINDSYYLVGILKENLKYSFELCYYLAFSVNYFKSFPIILISELNQEIMNIINTFKSYSYKALIMKGRDYLNENQ